MVFKIRDKSLFWTRGGWKNNWAPKSIILPKNISATETSLVTNHKDHHSFLRMVQSYRNYSRIFKQYTYGDKKLEHAFLMELRNAFRIPFVCSTPVELVKYGAERRMASHLDRNFELMSHNYHPFQLYAYNLQNKRLREDNEEADRAERKQQTLSQIIQAAFEQELNNQTQKLPRGEKLSIEKLGEVYSRVVNALREHKGETGATRGADGQFTDYIDKRRPFVEADNLRPSH